jgi:hypothetical protein
MTVGDFGDWQRLAQTGVGQDKIVILKCCSKSSVVL